jgi:hypothetical protein
MFLAQYFLYTCIPLKTWLEGILFKRKLILVHFAVTTDFLPVLNVAMQQLIKKAFGFYISLNYFFSASAAQRGIWPPRSGNFVITHNNAPQSVGLLWTSDQPLEETSTSQHTKNRPTFMPPMGSFKMYFYFAVLNIFTHSTHLSSSPSPFPFVNFCWYCLGMDYIFHLRPFHNLVCWCLTWDCDVLIAVLRTFFTLHLSLCLALWDEVVALITVRGRSLFAPYSVHI